MGQFVLFSIELYNYVSCLIRQFHEVFWVFYW